jgi:hypothetical protein
MYGPQRWQTTMPKRSPDTASLIRQVTFTKYRTPYDIVIMLVHYMSMSLIYDFQPQHSERLGQTQFRVLETYNVATGAHRLMPGHLSPMDFL